MQKGSNFENNGNQDDETTAFLDPKAKLNNADSAPAGGQKTSWASPTPFPLSSVWFALARSRQRSHRSPIPSPSASPWMGFGTSGQLSKAPLLRLMRR